MPSPHLTIVVAIDKQNGIGLNNQLPWHLPEDLAHFKRLTSGHPILMGRKTFESIGKPLPNRRNIVITRNPQWEHPGAERATSVAQALALCGDGPGFVIGGAELFKEMMPVVQRLVVTEIHSSFPCDTFFPPIDPGVWKTVSRQSEHSEKTGLDFDIVVYEKN